MGFCHIVLAHDSFFSMQHLEHRPFKRCLLDGASRWLYILVSDSTGSPTTAFASQVGMQSLISKLIVDVVLCVLTF